MSNTPQPTEALDWVQMFPGVRRRTRADSDTMTMIEIELSKGGAVPVHQHVNEQVTMCISGQITMTLDGATVVLNPNQCLFVPSNVKHSAAAITVDSVAYETFSPPRLDFRKKT